MEPVSPSAFRMNQAGYAAGLPVRFVVLTGNPVWLSDETGRLIRRIQADDLRPDAASGDRAALADLGCLPEGTYYLVCGQEKRPLAVQRQPWRKIGNALIKGLYYQRCGCGLSQVHAGVYAHPPCHTSPASDWENRSIVRRIYGGWHDAGDYGKYVGPGAVAAAHLLYAWKLFPEGCSDDLNIPETGSGVPDILSEARFELEWLLQMQRSDGAFYHKLTKTHFAPFIMPEEDLEPEYMMPVSHCATAAACACLALASRIWRSIDPAFSDKMLETAGRAWEWLCRNPAFVPFRNPEGVRTGGYGDSSDTDERFWAACELFASTGNTVYREAAEDLYASGMALTQFGWSNVAGLGMICCLFDLREKAGGILFSRLKDDFLQQSGNILSLSRQSCYGTALAADSYIWGSNMPILCNAMAMILHERLTCREDMRDAALLQWHYTLGMNAMDLCYVTGFGEKRVMHPHHRPSGADGIVEPVPGLLSGGPNNRFLYPAHRERFGENTPPAKCFLDETPSADTNEIAIYWNSPAVFVASYFNMLTSRP